LKRIKMWEKLVGGRISEIHFA